jgi:F-type H+-transporting ATPase subunit delta
MKTARHNKREARELLRHCTVNGGLDEGRVRHAVQYIIGQRRPAGLAMLSHFHRLVRLDRARHTATIESATAIPPDVGAQIESSLRQMHGNGLAVEYALDPSLIGGVRITVGSHVYDGSVRGSLAALAARFSDIPVAAS